jgi:hypothetical protein
MPSGISSKYCHLGHCWPTMKKHHRRQQVGSSICNIYGGEREKGNIAYTSRLLMSCNLILKPKIITNEKIKSLNKVCKIHRFTKHESRVYIRI